MQLTLLLTLPLLAAATTTTSNHNPRGITDKIKGAFGDADAIVRELSDCMVACSAYGLLDLNLRKCMNEPGKPPLNTMDCYCQKDDGNGTAADAGQAWENGVKRCFDPESLKENNKDSKRFAALGCKPDGYDEGNFLKLCKALDGESAEKKNETAEALTQRTDEVVATIDGATGKKGAAVAGGNGTADGKDSGAAGAAGPGMVARVAGAALAGAVAYAVAML